MSSLSCNYRNKENVQNVQSEVFSTHVGVFWPAKSKSNVHFSLLWLDNLNNLGGMWHTYGGRVPLRQAAMGLDSLSASLHPMMLAIGAITSPKALLLSRKINQFPWPLVDSNMRLIDTALIGIKFPWSLLILKSKFLRKWTNSFS